MQNKFTPDISKSLQHENKHELKTKIDNLSGQNWIKEIRELSSEFSLDAQKIITNVKHFLADAIDGEALKKEFEENKEHYQKYYEKLQNETFNEAKEITEALVAYISKVKKNTQTKLTHLLISNPGIEKRMPNILGEETPAVKKEEKNNIHEESISSPEQLEEKLIHEYTRILQAGLTPENIIIEIKKAFVDHYHKNNFVTKTFYRSLGLQEKYVKSFNEIKIPIVALLVLIKKNPADEKAKADLEIEIDRIVKPGFKTEGEQTLQRPGVTVITKIDLPEKDKHRAALHAKNEPMQKPTMNHLDYVGTEMSQAEFVTNCSLSYKELDDHKRSRDAVPGRYFRSIDVKDHPDRKAHFFTVWEEDGYDHTKINVYVETDASEKFMPNTVYKIKITWLQNSKNAWEKWKQIMSVRGELVKDEEVEESTWSGTRIWDINGAEKLLKIWLHNN